MNPDAAEEELCQLIRDDPSLAAIKYPVPADKASHHQYAYKIRAKKPPPTATTAGELGPGRQNQDEQDDEDGDKKKQAKDKTTQEGKDGQTKGGENSKETKEPEEPMFSLLYHVCKGSFAIETIRLVLDAFPEAASYNENPAFPSALYLVSDDSIPHKPDMLDLIGTMGTLCPETFERRPPDDYPIVRSTKTVTSGYSFSSFVREEEPPAPEPAVQVIAQCNLQEADAIFKKFPILTEYVTCLAIDVPEGDGTFDWIDGDNEDERQEQLGRVWMHFDGSDDDDYSSSSEWSDSADQDEHFGMDGEDGRDHTDENGGGVVVVPPSDADRERDLGRIIAMLFEKRKITKINKVRFQNVNPEDQGVRIKFEDAPGRASFYTDSPRDFRTMMLHLSKTFIPIQELQINMTRRRDTLTQIGEHLAGCNVHHLEIAGVFVSQDAKEFCDQLARHLPGLRSMEAMWQTTGRACLTGLAHLLELERLSFFEPVKQRAILEPPLVHLVQNSRKLKKLLVPSSGITDDFIHAIGQSESIELVHLSLNKEQLELLVSYLKTSNTTLTGVDVEMEWPTGSFAPHYPSNELDTIMTHYTRFNSLGRQKVRDGVPKDEFVTLLGKIKPYRRTLEDEDDSHLVSLLYAFLRENPAIWA